MNNLFNAITKLQDQYPGIEVDLYYSGVSQYPEGTWITPGEDFALLNDLASWNIIEQIRRPLWKDGQFRGYRIYFRYYLDMNYKSEP